RAVFHVQGLDGLIDLGIDLHVSTSRRSSSVLGVPPQRGAPGKRMGGPPPGGPARGSCRGCEAASRSGLAPGRGELRAPCRPAGSAGRKRPAAILGPLRCIACPRIVVVFRGWAVTKLRCSATFGAP